jgi:hypothetical protein
MVRQNGDESPTTNSPSTVFGQSLVGQVARGLDRETICSTNPCARRVSLSGTQSGLPAILLSIGYYHWDGR